MCNLIYINMWFESRHGLVTGFRVYRGLKKPLKFLLYLSCGMSWGFYVLSNKESAGFPQAVCSVESNTTHPSVVGASSQSASIQIIQSVLERKYVERKRM